MEMEMEMGMEMEMMKALKKATIFMNRVISMIISGIFRIGFVFIGSMDMFYDA